LGECESSNRSGAEVPVADGEHILGGVGHVGRARNLIFLSGIMQAQPTGLMGRG
jgi:hypothetical protein